MAAHVGFEGRNIVLFALISPIAKHRKLVIILYTHSYNDGAAPILSR
jgi:hypothetical protein